MTLFERNTRLALILLAAAMALPVAGCGDDGESTSPFADTYQVVVNTRNTEGCDSEGAPFDGDDYFQLTDEGDSLAYRVCSGPDDCQEAVNQNKSFDTQDGDTWIGRVIDASGIRDGCDVTFTESVARLDNGDITIETRTYSGEFSREDGQECSDQLVLDNRGALTCDQFDRVLAVPVE